MTDIQLLTAIHNNKGTIEYSELINHPPKKVKFSPDSDHQRLDHLRSRGFITGRLDAYSTVSLTPAGLAYLDDFMKEQENRRKQFAHDWRLAFFSAFLGALFSEPLWYFLTWIFQKFLSLYVFIGTYVSI